MNTTRYPEEFGPHRYSLRIDGLDLAGKEDLGELVFVMFNPATTQESRDLTVGSQTRRRCVIFARNMGCAALTEVNLFAYRAGSKQDVFEASHYTDVEGPENDRVLVDVVQKADMVVAAWGGLENRRLFENRAKKVVELLRPLGKQLYCLAKNDDGSPTHPVSAPNKDPIPWA